MSSHQCELKNNKVCSLKTRLYWDSVVATGKVGDGMQFEKFSLQFPALFFKAKPKMYHRLLFLQKNWLSSLIPRRCFRDSALIIFILVLMKPKKDGLNFFLSFFFFLVCLYQTQFWSHDPHGTVFADRCFRVWLTSYWNFSFPYVLRQGWHVQEPILGQYSGFATKCRPWSVFVKKGGCLNLLVLVGSQTLHPI